MSINEKTGRIRVVVHGETYSATWRVDGPKVVISSAMGEASAALGGPRLRAGDCRDGETEGDGENRAQTPRRRPF